MVETDGATFQFCAVSPCLIFALVCIFVLASVKANDETLMYILSCIGYIICLLCFHVSIINFLKVESYPKTKIKFTSPPSPITMSSKLLLATGELFTGSCMKPAFSTPVYVCFVGVEGWEWVIWDNYQYTFVCEYTGIGMYPAHDINKRVCAIITVSMLLLL